jgi:hypothetical protein
MARSNVSLPDRRFPRQSTHSIGDWQEMNLLYLSSSTPEVQACLSLSIRAVKSAVTGRMKSSPTELQVAASESIHQGSEHVAQ